MTVSKPHVHILCNDKVRNIPLLIDSPVVNQHFRLTRGPDIIDNPDILYCETGIYNMMKYVDTYNCVMFYAGNYWRELEHQPDKLRRVENMMRRMTMIICISKHLARVTRDKLKTKNITYLPGGMWGLDHVAYKVNMSRFEKKTNYEITSRPTVAMCISLAFEYKWRGMVDFLDLVRDISRRHKIKYVCYGRVKQNNDLAKRWIREYGLKYVHWHRPGETYDFTNGLGDLEWPQALTNSDIFVHPSYYDTWGCAIADAMCAGVPGLVYNINGPMEVGDAYVKCDPYDSDRIREEYIKLIVNSDYRKQIGNAMYTDAVERMDIHRHDFGKILMLIMGRMRSATK